MNNSSTRARFAAMLFSILVRRSSVPADRHRYWRGEDVVPRYRGGLVQDAARWGECCPPILGKVLAEVRSRHRAKSAERGRDQHHGGEAEDDPTRNGPGVHGCLGLGNVGSGSEQQRDHPPEKTLFEVEQRFDAALDGGHAEDVVACPANRQNPAWVSRSASLNWTTSSTASTMAPISVTGGGGVPNLDDDDAGPFAVALGGELELGAQVENWDDFAPEIDDAFDVGRHPGHRRDGTEADNLPDAENRQSIGLLAQRERQVAAGLRRCRQGGGSCRVSWVLAFGFQVGQLW